MALPEPSLPPLSLTSLSSRSLSDLLPVTIVVAGLSNEEGGVQVGVWVFAGVCDVGGTRRRSEMCRRSPRSPVKGEKSGC
ncbi:hypothetical protein Hanom_Chr14g01263151 [Helianthus anomalus]